MQNGNKWSMSWFICVYQDFCYLCEPRLYAMVVHGPVWMPEDVFDIGENTLDQVSSGV